MNDKESHGQASPGKPFTLRPSALSSSGSFDKPPQHTTKASLLRPSALTAIADRIESNAADVKKRKAGNESNQEQMSDSDNGSKKLRVESENVHQKGSLQLTEDVAPPQGIGTFGFVNADAKTPGKNSLQNSSNKKTESHGYVFGESMKERVTGFKDVSSPNASALGKETEVASNASEKDQEQTLADNASEHMKKEMLAKVHLKEVEVVTGEEGERNVLQTQCKLHLLCNDKSNWIEKGRGILKLNDICKSEKYDIFQSRLVFRRQGSHQVVLNTLLWPEMCYDKATSKSLRVTALDPETGKINIYLITGSQNDTTQLHTAIDRRVIALKRNQSETVSDGAASYNCNLGDEQGANVFPVTAPEDKEVSEDEEEVKHETFEDSSHQTDSGNSNDSMERET